MKNKEEMQAEEYLSIPENKVKFDNFKELFTRYFPDVNFEKLQFNLLERNNLCIVLSGEGEIMNITRLLNYFFPFQN